MERKTRARKILAVAAILLVAAAFIKYFLSPPVFPFLSGGNPEMEGPTGRVFRVPLTRAEKIRLALGCYFSVEVGDKVMQRITGGSVSDPLVVRLEEGSLQPCLILCYVPGRNVTAIYYADEDGTDHYWALPGKLAHRLYSRWESEFQASAE